MEIPLDLRLRMEYQVDGSLNRLCFTHAVQAAVKGQGINPWVCDNGPDSEPEPECAECEEGGEA